LRRGQLVALAGAVARFAHVAGVIGPGIAAGRVGGASADAGAVAWTARARVLADRGHAGADLPRLVAALARSVAGRVAAHAVGAKGGLAVAASAARLPLRAMQPAGAVHARVRRDAEAGAGARGGARGRRAVVGRAVEGAAIDAAALAVAGARAQERGRADH